MVGLPGGLNTLKEITLAFIVVLGPCLPGVVGELVVIPHRDPRVRGVSGEEVRVGAVQAVAHAIVLEHQNLVLGLDLAAKLVFCNGV